MKVLWEFSVAALSFWVEINGARLLQFQEVTNCGIINEVTITGRLGSIFVNWYQTSRARCSWNFSVLIKPLGLAMAINLLNFNSILTRSGIKIRRELQLCFV